MGLYRTFSEFIPPEIIIGLCVKSAKIIKSSMEHSPEIPNASIYTDYTLLAGSTINQSVNQLINQSISIRLCTEGKRYNFQSQRAVEN